MPEQTRRKVLLVDDERDLIRPLALRLEATGLYEVVVAFDGADGIARAVQFRPDVALIDLAMPEMDGWHLARSLREDIRTRKTKIIIMTAWLSRDLGRRALSEGVTQVLLKPFEETEMLAAIDSHFAPAHAVEGGAS